METQEQILERVYRKQRRKNILSTFAIILSLVLAIPIMGKTKKSLQQTEQAWLAQQNQ